LITTVQMTLRTPSSVTSMFGCQSKQPNRISQCIMEGHQV
jgi:hypothetical protein